MFTGQMKSGELCAGAEGTKQRCRRKKTGTGENQSRWVFSSHGESDIYYVTIIKNKRSQI